MIGRSDVSPPATHVIKFLRYLWDRWNIQAAVLASLAFQIILISSASSRKRTKDNFKIFMIWSMYLLADYVATFAIGLINNDARGPPITAADGEIAAVGEVAGGQESSCSGGQQVKHIAAFWAPFLLLHLGGPDTITAFSIEDNELWHRHMLTLMVQVIAVLLVFYRYHILADNPFLIPTLLISLAGFIKYVERTCSLNFASLKNMKKSMRKKNNPDYHGSDDAQVEKEGNINIKLTDMEVVEHGYKFYKIFRGLVVDHTFSSSECDNSKSFFSKLNDSDAFRVMEVELNFIYDAMFTKMIAVQGRILAYMIRVACTLLIVAATAVFFFIHPKNKLHHLDLKVSYSLLAGAIILDAIALTELFFSEWTVALILCKKKWIKKWEGLKQCTEWINKVCKLISFRKRWSGEIHQYSLINYSLNKRKEWVNGILDCFGLKEKVDSCLYSVTEPVTDKLRKLIFDEVKRKATQATQTRVANDIFLSRGEWALLDYSCGPTIMATVGQDVEFDQSVLIWHIATEICYFTLEKDNDDDREICRFMSEYLVYLLVMEQNFTSSLAGILETRFEDTCEEASNVFGRRETPFRKHGDDDEEVTKGIRSKLIECIQVCLKTAWDSAKEDIMYIAKLKWFFNKNGTDRKMTEWEKWRKEKEFKKRKNACEFLGNDSPHMNQLSDGDVKKDGSKSVLLDALILAKGLQELCSTDKGIRKDEEDPVMKKYSKKEVWEMVGRVWVELLSYAAGHCRGDAHAQQVAKGGELLTFVWLLMAHFGVGDQSRIETGQGGGSVVV